jgi:hypothetical protein
MQMGDAGTGCVTGVWAKSQTFGVLEGVAGACLGCTWAYWLNVGVRDVLS